MGLNDLDTTAIKDDVDFGNLPEQMGGYAPMPQPGPYRFKLSPLGPDSFDLDKREGEPDRMKVKFDEHAPLTITQASPANQAFVGEPFRTTISNRPRKRGKGDDAPMASDADYLLQALGAKERPKSNRAYADLLLAKSKEQAEFGADIEWSWHCNPKRDAQWVAEDGSLVTVALEEGSEAKRTGCGTRIYQKDVKKGADGKVPERVTCPNPDCQASVRGFANLTRFKA